MGSDITCPCGNNNLENEESQENQDLIAKVMQGKLTQSDIILEFLDEQTKICLIKTNHIEQFFNNRNLLRINPKKENSRYYNSVFISNYLGRTEFAIVCLQESPFKIKSFIGVNANERTFTNYSNNHTNQTTMNNHSLLEQSGKYSVDFVNLVSSQPEQVVEQLLHDLKSKLKKNYLFTGIINDFPKNNRQFFVLSRLGYSKEDITDYSITVFSNKDRDLNENDINEIISSSENCYKRLKAIMIDFVYVTLGKKEDEKIEKEKEKINFQTQKSNLNKKQNTNSVLKNRIIKSK